MTSDATDVVAPTTAPAATAATPTVAPTATVAAVAATEKAIEPTVPKTSGNEMQMPQQCPSGSTSVSGSAPA